MREMGANLPADSDSLRRSLASAQQNAPAERPKAKPSRRAQQLWDRLSDWYGVRFADQFGDQPSPDWCRIVDGSTNEQLVAVMTLVRQRHVTFPPTLPEFCALVKESSSRRTVHTTLVQDELTDFVCKHRQLAPEQMLGRYWTFRYRELPDGSLVVTAVEIAAAGGNVGYRVSVDDMNSERTEL